jgi:dUTP pyrophosphatase
MTHSFVTVPVQVLPHGEGLSLPAYATPGAAGLDLRCALPQPLTLQPGQRELVPTGIAVALPPGTEGQVRPRSGLATRHGITVLNAPGTVDSDYRGEVKVLLINLGSAPVVLERGDRIAQFVVAMCTTASLKQVDCLDDTERGSGGFGHTGKD